MKKLLSPKFHMFKIFGLGAIIMVAAGLLLSTGSAIQALDKSKEREKICTQAEERYQEVFGKPSSNEEVVIVKMYKYNFCPFEITVPQGTTVRFVNVDKRTSHSVWFKEAGKAESERLFPDEKVEMKFDLPVGDYPYLCGPHWKVEGMIGRVTVTK